MRKLLIGVHDKNCSLRAVTWLMRQFPEVRNLETTLVHVIPDLPAMYWDDGHILTPTEEGERRRVIETWAARQRDFIEPILQGAVHDLIRHGFPQDRVGMKIVLGSGDVVDSLLDLAKEGGYQTERMVREGMDLLSRRSYQELGRLLKIPAAQAQQIAQFISDNLNPYPARAHWGEASQHPQSNPVYRDPDIIISQLNSRPDSPLIVEVASPYAGALRVNPMFREAIEQAPAEKVESWQAHLDRAVLLVKCIQQRNVTLVRLVRRLVVLQRAFILHGDQHLMPFTRARLASELEVHESTVSRAVSEKAIQMPNGQEGLLEPYDSHNSVNLRDPNSMKAAENAWFGIYIGTLGFATIYQLPGEHPELSAPTSWDDLIKPEWQGQIQVAHPSSSGTSYTALCTMIQMKGEEAAWEYERALTNNVFSLQKVAPPRPSLRGRAKPQETIRATYRRCGGISTTSSISMTRTPSRCVTTRSARRVTSPCLGGRTAAGRGQPRSARRPGTARRLRRVARDTTAGHDRPAVAHPPAALGHRC